MRPCVRACVGKSLLWVAILGLIVFYIYALISFALLRSSFDPDSELYCATLWQCTITVIRYGLVGDLFDVSIHSSSHLFSYLVIYFQPSMLCRCWLGGRKGIRPEKTEWWGAGVVIL